VRLATTVFFSSPAEALSHRATDRRYAHDDPGLTRDLLPKLGQRDVGLRSENALDDDECVRVQKRVAA
jgi:hypothetical protein